MTTEIVTIEGRQTIWHHVAGSGAPELTPPAGITYRPGKGFVLVNFCGVGLMHANRHNAQVRQFTPAELVSAATALEALADRLEA